MPWPPLSLIKRLVKGVPITPAEEDTNKTDIETAVNAINAALSASLNPNGTFKPGSADTASLQDRCVTLPKLAFLSSFWAADTGAVNAIAISFTPACTAYAAGQVFWVKVVATNTGATTLKVDALAPVSVQQFTSGGMGPLAGGELMINGEYVFVFDGTQFVVLNPTPTAAVTHGIPVLIAPALVAAFAAPIAWQNNFNITASVPAGATGVILAADINFESNDPGGSDFRIKVRPDALGDEQTVAYCHAGTNTGSGNYNQGTYLFSNVDVGGGNVRHIDYEATLSGTVVYITANLYVVGYIT